MTLHTPVWMQPVTGDAAINFTGQELRQVQQALMTQAHGVGGWQGVLSASGWQVTQRGLGANLTVDVASGLAAVTGADVTNQGPYWVWNDGTVSVGPFTVPGSGTFVHRVCLQIQDKLANGAYPGYAGNLVIVAGTGSGDPQPEPPSAVTLATVSVAAGQASILNSNITDYRQRIGPVAAFKTADLGRATTALADDPDLQLLNLAASSWYEFTGAVIYSGGSGASEGDLEWAFRTTGVTSMRYSHGNYNLANTLFGTTVSNGTDSNTAGTQGTGTDLPLTMAGFIRTGGAPCSVVLQWAQNTLQPGTNSWLRAGSLLRARKIG